MAGAKVKYAIYRGPYYFPLWYDPEDDDARSMRDGDPGDNDFGSEQIQESEGVLDSGLPGALGSTLYVGIGDLGAVVLLLVGGVLLIRRRFLN